ncbi:MAG: helix-turn-helix transcriptional regulator [Alphaproteobacteria bacterium]|nr:MAG: helix-turn-helix transcriptional regulator [Alphaproteobacteria bacterium]
MPSAPASPLPRAHDAVAGTRPVADMIDLSGAGMRTRQLPAGSEFGSRRDLPIMGRAQGGNDGNLNLDTGALDWTFRPADLQGVRDAFAVFVTGDSMLPKYKDRDMAYVHPGKTPRRGRYVLVETREHKGFIKQFDRWDGDTLVVRQYNPIKEIRIPRTDVLRLMLVIGSLDA